MCKRVLSYKRCSIVVLAFTSEESSTIMPLSSEDTSGLNNGLGDDVAMPSGYRSKLCFLRGFRRQHQVLLALKPDGAEATVLKFSQYTE